MKTTFPRYNKKEIEPLFFKFKPKDKKLIEDFIIFCGGTAGRTTTAKYRRIMIKTCEVFEGDLDKIDLQRLREFLNLVNNSDLKAPTKNEIRKVLKRFLKETYDDWSLRFKELRDIKGESEKDPRRFTSDNMLKPLEVESLVAGELDMKYKVVIMLLHETAGRPEEILKLKWKDINLDRGSVQLYSSKKGSVRINPIQNSVIHLKRYKQEYHYPNVSPDDYIFPSPYDRNKHQTLAAFSVHLKGLSKRILKRNIFPYLFRHSRLNQLMQVLPAKVYEKFADHSIETASRYEHLDEEDVRNAMFDKVYKIDEIPESKRQEFEKQIRDLKEEIKEIKKTAVDDVMKKVTIQLQKIPKIELP